MKETYTTENISKIERAFNLFAPDFDKLTDVNGIKVLPTDVYHFRTGRKLMQGYMDLEAFIETVTTEDAVIFWSRSQNKLWLKGEGSGNRLKISAITTDCDQDNFVIYAEPLGPVCHTGANTCYDNSPILYFDPNYQIPGRRESNG